MRKLVIRLTALLAFGLIAGLVLAQSPKPATPPSIPDALKAQFFKAQSQKIQADIQAQQKQQAFQQVVDALTAACGSTFQPQMNAAGDPVCAAKPEEKPKEKK